MATMASPVSIAANPAAEVRVHNEATFSRTSRITEDGRNIHYDLQVVQQPDRARACGSGVKSSADRRPVDPPPIVRLQLREGATWETGKDITFDYHSSFFLYVSLETARPMASGNLKAPTQPVLTGMPVSGAAYLDRPHPAVYFLFPDLAVRHEGYYRLSFSLFECYKDSNSHFDPNGERHPATGGSGEEDSWLNVMNVKSHSFQVFIAKKFPGLCQSTVLSRAISDQGCRVRIRRDIRMRRRKNGDIQNAPEQENHRPDEEYTRANEQHSPADPRRRSSSRGSVDHAPYPYGPHRRPSGAEYGPPLVPASQQQPMLSFGPGAYASRPPPRHPGPVSPSRGGFQHGLPTPSYHHPQLAPAPAPAPAPGPELGGPPQYYTLPSPIGDDRRPSYGSSAISYPAMQPPALPPPSLPPPSLPPPSLPPPDTNYRRPTMFNERSPVSSPRSSLAPSSATLSHVDLRPSKRSYDDGDTCEERTIMQYKRSGGSTAEKDHSAYGFGAPTMLRGFTEEEDPFRTEVERSRKRMRANA